MCDLINDIFHGAAYDVTYLKIFLAASVIDRTLMMFSRPLIECRLIIVYGRYVIYYLSRDIAARSHLSKRESKQLWQPSVAGGRCTGCTCAMPHSQSMASSELSILEIAEP